MEKRERRWAEGEREEEQKEERRKRGGWRGVSGLNEGGGADAFLKMWCRGALVARKGLRGRCQGKKKGKKEGRKEGRKRNEDSFNRGFLSIQKILSLELSSFVPTLARSY